MDTITYTYKDYNSAIVSIIGSYTNCEPILDKTTLYDAILEEGKKLLHKEDEEYFSKVNDVEAELCRDGCRGIVQLTDQDNLSEFYIGCSNMILLQPVVIYKYMVIHKWNSRRQLVLLLNCLLEHERTHRIQQFNSSSIPNYSTIHDLLPQEIEAERMSYLKLLKLCNLEDGYRLVHHQ